MKRIREDDAWRQWWHQNIWLMPQCPEMLVLGRCEPSIMTQRQVSICIPPLSWQEGLMLLFYDSLPVSLGNDESCARTNIPLFTWYSWDFLEICVSSLLTKWNMMIRPDFYISGVLDVKAVRTNSSRPCRVKGQIFECDLTLPHTDWTPQPLT